VLFQFFWKWIIKRKCRKAWFSLLQLKLYSFLSDQSVELVAVLITHADLVDVLVTMTIVLDSVPRRCALWLVELCLLSVHVLNCRMRGCALLLLLVVDIPLCLIPICIR